MDKIQLWEILVPTSKNDGTPIRTRHHRAWDTQVKKISGGITIFQPAIGKWIAPNGTLYKDRMIPVRIACTSEQMDEIIRRTLNHYSDQTAVFAYKLSEEVRIVHRNKDYYCVVCDKWFDEEPHTDEESGGDCHAACCTKCAKETQVVHR